MRLRVFLNPGQVYFGEGEKRIETLLGSCVAVTIWHPARRIGGMCHFLLPDRPTPGSALSRQPDGRYGNEAIQALIEQARLRGTRIGDYHIKIFGGGRILDIEPEHGGVGERNAAFVREALASLGLTAVAADLSGDGYRYLKFDLDTGDVWVKYGPGVAPSSANGRPNERRKEP